MKNGCADIGRTRRGGRRIRIFVWVFITDQLSRDNCVPMYFCICVSENNNLIREKEERERKEAPNQAHLCKAMSEVWLMFVSQVPGPLNTVSRAPSEAARLWGSQEVWSVFIDHRFLLFNTFAQVHIIALPLVIAGGFKPPTTPHRHLRPLPPLPHRRGPLLHRWLVSLSYHREAFQLPPCQPDLPKQWHLGPNTRVTPAGC